MRRSRALSLLALAVFSALILAIPHAHSQQGPVVLVLTIDGAITTSTAELVAEAVQEATVRNAVALIIQLNTPGGLVSATIDIIDAIEQSRIPVVTYVAPQGARAWSAGAFILVGSHVAAMSPFTITGSSQPVAFDPVGGSQPINDTKTLNALTAYIEERARTHGRNETAARDFVLKNLNLNEELALRYGVIEIIASSLPELILKLNGMQVETAAGSVTINTTNVSVENYSGSIRLRLLEVISDPILASMALLIGTYAVIFGLSAPGHMTEIIGAFLLIIGLIGIGLSVNLGALLLVAVGAILMIAEAYSHTHGALAGTGLVFVVIGSLLLVPFESTRWIISVDFYQTFVYTILAASSIIGAFTIIMVYKVLRARMLKPIMGKIIGEKVTALDDLAPGKEGYVKYYAEYWRAKSTQEIKAGSSAIVVSKDGTVLTVKPAGE